MMREVSDIEVLKGAKVDEPLTLQDGTSLRAVPDPHGTGCSRCPLEKLRECPPSLRWSCVDARRSFLPGLPEGFDEVARANGYIKDDSFSLISRSDAEELVEMYYDPQGVHLDRFMEKMRGVMKGLRRGLIEKSKREGR